MRDCIFCKVISKEIKGDVVYEDDRVMVFKDINPQAPVHYLIIPKEHIASLSECSEGEKDIIGELIFRAKEIAAEIPELAGGFRVVINDGKDAGQAVFHIHVHLLGGRRMSWPPG